ncbi:MAG: hypothetical protein EZS28_027165 [Streblomastix strix]|uniref:RRM domain-containing protein n=1 Tax=Streblomastix strix TaxID=222440 RepID=A0A5J4V4N1_9EUKA|nr:MAG: hypothetical protein EZS28_027165 [Streblomastix strix]
MSQQTREPAPPNRIVHVGGLTPSARQEDLYAIAQRFGSIQDVVMMRNQTGALLEFRELESAIQFVTESKQRSPILHGKQLFAEYSFHQEMWKSTDRNQTNKEKPMKRELDTYQASRILLVTIHNPLFPITVDVLNQIFSPFEPQPRQTVQTI